MTRVDTGGLLRAALPVTAILATVVFVGATLAVAGDTLGHDFLAYHLAARRVLDGQPLYDMSFEVAGGFGLFFYPPAFLPLVLPLGWLDATTATWLWAAILVAVFLVGLAVLPVSRSTRWLVLLLAGLSWPFAFAVKLGQVGPILFFLFAVGWRWLDNPRVVGATMALGTAVKIQPVVLFVWAAITGRWRAIAVGLAVLLGLSLVATALAGPSAWADFVTLLGQVVDPVRTDRNRSPGAVLFQMGVDAGIASVVQLVWMVVVGGLVLVAAARATAEASYMVAVIASQLLSPILWDHYAMLLLLPVAYLLSAGVRWAVLIPLATMTPFINVIPPAVYPVAFAVTLLATLAVGLRRPTGFPAGEPALA